MGTLAPTPLKITLVFVFLKIEKRIRYLERSDAISHADQVIIWAQLRKLRAQLHALDPTRALQLATAALRIVTDPQMVHCVVTDPQAIWCLIFAEYVGRE